MKRFKIKDLWIKVKAFFKKFGIEAVLAIAIWYAPTWLAIFIPELKPFALTWLGLLTSPIIPVVVVVPVTAIFLHWLRKKIWQLILYIKDQLEKVKMTNELLAYVSRDELKIVLGKFKQIGKFSKQEKEKFNKKHSTERMKMLKGSWEKL